MIDISIICDYYGIRRINYNNNTISICNNEVFLISINSQSKNVSFTLDNLNSRSYIHLYINIIGKGAISTYYSHSPAFNLNKKLISLNYYYIYIIKNYYLDKKKCYCTDFYARKQGLYKLINTMKLNKNVALII